MPRSGRPLIVNVDRYSSHAPGVISKTEKRLVVLRACLTRPGARPESLLILWAIVPSGATYPGGARMT